MNRAKLFIENFLAYGFISILNKIIPFLLLPVITRLLSDPSDFGVYDMFNQIIGFGSPFIILGIYDAMFREYFEKEDQLYRYGVTATAQRIVFFTSIIGCTFLLVFNKSLSKIFFGESTFGNIVCLSAISLFISTNSTIIAAPTRLENKRKVYILSGLISTTGGYLISILLLLLGYSYFALIYSNIITAAILMIFFLALNIKFFTLGSYNRSIFRELLKLGLPQMPTFIIYWVYNSMDRIMVANILGTSELGIYSIGAKVASVSLLVYTAFSGGWGYFAYSTMKDADYEYLVGKVYEYVFIVSTAFSIVAIIFKDLIFDIMFTGEYIKGVSVFPYLLLSPFLLMYYQTLAIQFQVIKKTYYSPLVLLSGAITNIALNFYMIPRMGVKGAAIATLIGYCVTNIITIVFVKIKNLVVFSRRVIFMIGMFIIVFIVIDLYSINIYTILLGISYLLLSVLLYYHDIEKLISKGSH